MKEFKFTIDGHKYEVSVNEVEPQQAEVVVNGTTFKVQIEKTEKEPAVPIIRRATAQKATAPVNTGKSQVVKSPLPGSIVNVLVSVGQSVKRGDTLLTMESMKMENQIKADQDGIVKAIFVEKGANVMQDDKLLELEGVATSQPQPQAAPTPKPEMPKPAAPKAETKQAAPVAGGIKVKSPLPGSVVRIPVSEGQTVKRGDDLVILESMKMENAIKADREGVVKQILVSQGQNVMQDDVLVVME